MVFKRYFFHVSIGDSAAGLLCETETLSDHVGQLWTSVSNWLLREFVDTLSAALPMLWPGFCCQIRCLTLGHFDGEASHLLIKPKSCPLRCFNDSAAQSGNSWDFRLMGFESFPFWLLILSFRRHTASLTVRVFFKCEGLIKNGSVEDHLKDDFFYCSVFLSHVWDLVVPCRLVLNALTWIGIKMNFRDVHSYLSRAAASVRFVLSLCSLLAEAAFMWRLRTRDALMFLCCV